MSIESDRPDLIEFVYVLRIADKRQLEYMAEQIAEERKARRNWFARVASTTRHGENSSCFIIPPG